MLSFSIRLSIRFLAFSSRFRWASSFLLCSSVTVLPESKELFFRVRISRCMSLRRRLASVKLCTLDILERNISKDLESVRTEIVLARTLTGVFGGSILGDCSSGNIRPVKDRSEALRSSGFAIEAVSIACRSCETCFLHTTVSNVYFADS